MVLHSSSFFFCDQTDRFREAHLHSLTGKPTRRLPTSRKSLKGWGARGEGKLSGESFPSPALSPYLFAMPVNAAGKSAEAAADERAGRPASAGERTKASTEDRTPGSAAQEALLGLVHVRAANGPENQRADQKYG